MVSTRQMCGSAASGAHQESSSASASSSASSSCAASNASSSSDLNGNSRYQAAGGAGEAGESSGHRTSVLRRTHSLGNPPHSQSQSLLSSPASLAYSASVVTRHHSYSAQRMRSTRDPPRSTQLLDLPNELLEKIVGYLDYKKVSQLRLVSHRFNDICMAKLNSAFSRQIKTTFNRFQSIKASMPRRESARRHHPLACECDIIETCYMRLSLLQMSMGKHIERGHCCFFPGAVRDPPVISVLAESNPFALQILDEVQTILNYISITPQLQRPYRVTDELFDLSTMAMEYFKDRIEPTLPGLAYFNKDFYTLPTTIKRPILAISSDLEDSASNSPPQNHMVLRKGIRKIKQGMKMYNNQLSVLRTELRTCKRKAGEQSKQLAEQQNLLAEQQKQTLEYANRLDENDKKNEEMARKFSTLLQELNKCKTELQFWRSKSPAIPAVCSSCNQKAAPVVPPEDFQALVNQGVDPGHFIIGEDGDGDGEGDVDGEADGDGEGDGESDVSAGEPKEFTSPDESTTAKLLAVSTAARNLKRKQPAQQEAQSNAIASTSKAAAVAASQTNNQQTSGGGYSPKLFYGNHQRSGVIVSPVSMKLPAVAHLAGLSEAALEEQQHHQQQQEEEVKKARRVQKASRHVNTAAGKRNKI
ncbi:hypothetical protein KR018_000492 [Drosophila ironensis]|nr:hypothetical protein KR018_000492 [Drosophila ironensis]